MSSAIDYLFTAEGQQPDCFDVVSFRGQDLLCRPFSYTLKLKSTNHDIDIEQLTSCHFSYQIGESQQQVYGLIAEFEQLQHSGDYALYQVKLVPRLWRLGLYRTNEVYLQQNVEDTLTQVLEETGLLQGSDFELSFSSSYRTWEFRIQYRETFLDFIHRICEREGIYYYFDHSNGCDKVIFTDTLSNHLPMTDATIEFRQAGGLNVMHFGNTVSHFVSRQQPVPAKVVIKDYNDESPLVDISAEAEVDANGYGELFFYGDNIESPDEAKQIANVRAEEQRSRKRRFYGEGLVNRLQPGYLFTLKNHFRTTYNCDYLVIDIEHEGFSPRFLTHLSAAEQGDQPVYRNSFTAIKSDLQFRPERLVEKQRVFGTLNANIDAEGDGHYAELDEVGRYRVVIPFDRQTRGEGKASYWVRMSQPYAGEGHGMHFPLHKGAEVLLTFIEGDPDRPVISGAVPNHLQTSVVDRESQTNSRIKTASGNMIELEDKDDCRRIKLQSPQSGTYLHLGAANADGEGVTEISDGLRHTKIFGGVRYLSATKGHENVTEPAYDFEPVGIFAFPKLGDGAEFSKEEELSGGHNFSRRLGESYFYTEDDEYYFGGGTVYNLGTGWEESHKTATTIRTKPPSHAAAIGKFGVDPTGIPDDCSTEIVFSDSWASVKGNDYSVMDGDSFEYVKGNSKAWVYGNSEETVVGNSTSTMTGNVTETMTGNTTSTTTGNTTETTTGNTVSTTIGNTVETYVGNTVATVTGNSAETFVGGQVSTTVGGQVDTYVGGQVATTIAAAVETFIGAKMETNIGAILETTIAAKAEIALGAVLECDLTNKTEVDSSNIQAKITELKTNASKIDTIASYILSGASKIDALPSKISTGMTDIKTKITNLFV
ncbi:MAG: type VI secretion system tip protein VgrG [Gammaproteobacteria bacterium]|nr:type VI secretion system tip protein VgrG [Gammaproteobacteria bacterium]